MQPADTVLTRVYNRELQAFYMPGMPAHVMTIRTHDQRSYNGSGEGYAVQQPNRLSVEDVQGRGYRRVVQG